MAGRKLARLVGEEPPYHVPAFVLTQHPRAPLHMAGGTSFHFVTGGIHDALERAREAAGGRDVRLGGGVATVRQYLQAGLVGELHLALAPVLLGRGEALFAGSTSTRSATNARAWKRANARLHLFLRKRPTDTGRISDPDPVRGEEGLSKPKAGNPPEPCSIPLRSPAFRLARSIRSRHEREDIYTRRFTR